MTDSTEPNLVDMEFTDKDITTAVFEAIGAASTCWENMSNTGVFQDGRAKHIGDQLVTRIFQEIRDAAYPEHPGDEKEEPVNTQAAQPQEWIERQEEERRAWAVNTTVEIFKAASNWDIDALVPTAGAIVNFVKGPEKEDPDLHDQDAFDTWGVVMTEQLSEMLFSKRTADLTDQERDFIEARLNDFSDSLTKQGVRLKNGERFDRLVDDA